MRYYLVQSAINYRGKLPSVAVNKVTLSVKYVLQNWFSAQCVEGLCISTRIQWQVKFVLLHLINANMSSWAAGYNSNLAKLRTMKLTVQKEQSSVLLGEFFCDILPGVIAGYCSKFFYFPVLVSVAEIFSSRILQNMFLKTIVQQTWRMLKILITSAVTECPFRM